MKKRVSVEMLDDLASCAARLSKSLKRHKVNVSTDRVMEDLSTQIEMYASGKEVRANTRTSVEAGEFPPYNMAADLLSTAYSMFEQGNVEQALKQVIVAFQADGAPELAQAMAAMNDESEEAGIDHEAVARTSILAEVEDDESEEDDEPTDFTDDEDDDEDDEDEDESDEDEDESEDDESETTAASKPDDDEDDDESNEDESVIQGVLSELEEPDVMDVSDDDDANEDEDALSSRFQKVSASSRDNLIMANKVALTGTPQARRVAKQLLD